MYEFSNENCEQIKHCKGNQERKCHTNNIFHIQYPYLLMVELQRKIYGVPPREDPVLLVEKTLIVVAL